MTDVKWGISNSTLSACTGYLALEQLLSAVNTKSAMFQEQLSRAPEITETVIETAKESAKALSMAEYSRGLSLAIISGVMGGAAIYQFLRKD